MAKTITIHDNIFRQYDIRGVFNEELSVGLAEALARGYAKYLRDSLEEKDSLPKGRPLKVTIGRDVRLSSTELRDALIKGLTESSVDCIDLGECPTPLQYFSLYADIGAEVDGGIMITGSHNPPEYNGFKISVGKETIHGTEIQRLKGYVKEAASNEKTEAEGAREGIATSVDIISSYVDFHVERFVKTLPKLKKPIKVVIDSGNGTGGLVAPALLKKLGCEVVELFCEVDGTFPNHHPDPTVPENLKALISKVKKRKADFGVGYDGDSDRIGVVDEKGSIIWGDLLMVIFARDIINVQPDATIVGEVKCSQTLYDEIARIGGKPVMWKTGHSLIKSKMKELKAAMAGEMSGHIFFADRYFGFDDAIYATCRLVEILSARREKEPGAVFSDLLSGLPETIVTPEIRVGCPDEEKFEVIERLKTLVSTAEATPGLKIKEIIDIDGLRVVFEGGWALVRASNTQPVLVLRYEAESETLLERFKGYVKEKLKEAGPQCVLPD